jgi:hypothetical protein
MSHNNTLQFVNAIINRLKDSGIDTVIFGGWAEELSGTIRPRPHKDVDLLYIADSFSKVEEFLKNNTDVQEIIPKRFPHKRAFMCNDVMVELLLLTPFSTGYVTDFWNQFKLMWPLFDTQMVFIPPSGLAPIAPPTLIEFYKKNYNQIEEIRKRNLY